MSIPYLETYLVNGTTIGIEDLKDGQPDHFMPDRQTQRFHLWTNGCGFGAADTLDDARQKAYDYITETLDAAIVDYEAVLMGKLSARKRLGGDDPAKLLQFLQSND